MKNLTFVFLIIVCFSSCKRTEIAPFENNYFFENPQPINNSELSKIPNKFLGTYIDSNAVKLNFTADMIIRITNYKFRFHKKALDSLKKEFDVVDGKYISKNPKEVYQTKMIGDSIEFQNESIDTIFKFSDFQKAKCINGNLILSEKDSIFWRINMVILNKNKLTIKHLYSDSDLKSMDSITKIHSKQIDSKQIDSTNYIIAPSRSEFKKFLALKKFGYDQEFLKLSK